MVVICSYLDNCNRLWIVLDTLFLVTGWCQWADVLVN